MKNGMKLKALLLGFSICAASGAVATTAMPANEAPATVTSAYADRTTGTDSATEAGAETTAKDVASVADKTYATLQEAINAAETGATVKLLADVNSTEQITISKNITLDLNGKTLCVDCNPPTAQGQIVISAEVTICDSSAEQTGAIKTKYTATSGITVEVLASNKLILESGTIYGMPAGSPKSGNAVVIRSNASFDMKGGKIICNDAIRMSSAVHLSSADASFTLANGEILVTGDETTYGIRTASGSTVAIQNGKITASQALDIKGSLTIYGGEFNGALSLSSNTTIYDGTFTNYFEPKYLATGYGIVATTINGTTTYGVKDGFAAQIVHNNTFGKACETLQEAIEAAEAGDTVYLLNNVSDFAGVIVQKDLTVNFGKYTVTGATGATVFKVSKANVHFTATADGGINGGSGGDNNAIWAADGANVTILSGKYTVGGDANGAGNSTVYVTETGKVNIKGGTFSSQKAYQGRYYVLNLNNKSTGTITVSGGKFINYNPAKGDDNLGGNFLAANCGMTRGNDDDGNITYTVSSAATVQIFDKDGNYIKALTSLQKAIDAANENDVIMLLGNITKESNITIAQGKIITLDLNGHTLSTTAVKKAVLVNYGTITITDTSKAQKGTIKRTDTKASSRSWYYVIDNQGEMVIKQAIVSNDSGSANCITGSALIRNGGTQTASLTIENGTFTQNRFIVIKNDDYGKLYINGGTFNSEKSVAVENYAHAEITGGVINGCLFTTAWDAKFDPSYTLFTGTAELNGALNISAYEHRDSVKMSMDITGGVLNLTQFIPADNHQISISGGTLTGSEETIAKLKDYAAEGYVLVKNTDGSYSPAETVIKQSQAALGSDITMKFFLSSADYTVSVTLNKNGSEEITKLESSGTTENGLYIYSFTGLTPQMINRSFTVNVYNGNVLRDSYTYSVLEYCNHLLAQTSTTEKTKTLIAELLNYGKAAQEYLGADSAELTKAIEKAGLTTGSDIDTDAAITNSGKEIIVSGATLNFSHDNKVVFVIAKDMYAKLGDYTVTVNGTKITADEWKASGDYYMWYSEGILATAFDKDYTMLISDAKTNEKLQELTISVNAYCATANKLDGASAKLKNLVIATYNYGKAAKAYAAK